MRRRRRLKEDADEMVGVGEEGGGWRGGGGKESEGVKG